MRHSSSRTTWVTALCVTAADERQQTVVAEMRRRLQGMMQR